MLRIEQERDGPGPLFGVDVIRVDGIGDAGKTCQIGKDESVRIRQNVYQEGKWQERGD